MRVAIKYCGSCNPQTDVGWIGCAVRRLLEERNIEIVPFDSANLDAAILLCGCPRACVDRPEVSRLAPATVVVAGETVNWTPTQEANIPSRVQRELEKLSVIACNPGEGEAPNLEPNGGRG